MKSILFTMCLTASFMMQSSCTEVSKRLDDKMKILDEKAGQLDSMLMNELNKVQQLDTIIHDEMERARQLDSIIQRSRVKMDSILNRK
jgi:hypothetical protein